VSRSPGACVARLFLVLLVLAVTLSIGVGMLAALTGATPTGAALTGLGGAAGAGGPSPGGPGIDLVGRSPATGRAPVIPPGMLVLYRQAASTCTGLPWQILAAVGTVESANGTSSLPGVHQGANSAGAEGPMQFEPSTFAEYAWPVPPGGVSPPSPYDPTDAVYAAARMLCANGGLDAEDLPGALWAYNHATFYVTDVLAVAASLGWSRSLGARP